MNSYAIRYPFPIPTHIVGYRTAILISGNLRSGNISLSSSNVYVHNNHFIFQNESRTPIETILEDLIAPLAMHGGVDLFIYVPTSRFRPTKTIWDGNPVTYEPYDGDTRSCELYSNNPIFHKDTGNKAFCLTEYERQLSNQFINTFDYWKKYWNKEPHAIEGFLQQEYGKYRANQAAKEYALSKGFQYKYKVRLRPDDAMIRRFPDIESMQFTNTSIDCPGSTIYYANRTIFGYSTADSFNIGESDAMDNLLDRYQYMITKPFNWTQTEFIFRGSVVWNSERHLRNMLKNVFGICMKGHKDILMTKIRKVNYTATISSNKRPRKNREWMELHSFLIT